LGAYIIQVGPHFPVSVFIYSLPIGLLAVATLQANNMRDIEGDALAGKHTLTTIIGLSASRVLYLLLMLATYGLILYLGIPHKAPHLILLTLWTLPTLTIAIIGIMRTNAPTGFHLVMNLTLKLEILFAILLMIGLIVTAIIPVLSYIPLPIPKF